MNLSTLRNLQDDLYYASKAIENNMIKIYNNEEFIRDLSERQPEEDLRKKYKQIAYEMSRSDFDISQNIVALYFYTINHQLISVYRHAQTPKYNYPEDLYDNHVDANQRMIKEYISSNNRTMFISSYYNTNRDINLLRFIIKVYGVDQTPVGYLVCDVDPKNFIQILKKYQYSQDPVIWIQPGGDRVALMQGGIIKPAQVQAFEWTENKVMAKDNWQGSMMQFDQYTLFQVGQKKYNFTVYSLVPQFILEHNQSILVRNILLCALMLFPGFLWLSLVISRNLTEPLHYMVKIINQIKGGRTKLRMKQMNEDEIGILGKNFNEMLDWIEVLSAREYEGKLLLHDVKYKALQAQVNPHFLYNTLDTMSAIAASQHCPTVGTLCRALSNLFRYSLKMEEPFSTLEDELLHIKNYMYVMNVRMSNSIECKFQIDHVLLGAKIPRLSLQPLVENAIKHGLKNKHGDKFICIIAKLKDDILMISVEDNGVGMNAETINLCLENSMMDALQKSTSIGMDNINARIKMLYGIQYGMAVSSEKGKGSKVLICLPYVRKEEKDD